MNNSVIYRRRRIIVAFSFLVIIILIVSFMSFMITTVAGHMSSNHDEDTTDSTVFDGRECLASEIRVEAKLASNSFGVGNGVNFSVETTLSSTTPCKISTDFKHRKLTITNSDGVVVYAVTDQCVTVDDGLIILPGEVAKEDVFWRGKSTTKLVSGERYENGEAVLDDNGNPVIGQWCEPGDDIQKGSYTAQFTYDTLPGMSSSPALSSNQIGFTLQ